jgi:hypothetical protein
VLTGPAGAPAPLVTGDPATWDQPAALRALRERGRVQPVTLPGGLVAWLVTGAAEARAALADDRLALDPRRVADPAHGFGGRRWPGDIFAAEGRHLLNSDGADHRRLRAVVAPLLSPAAARRWQPRAGRAATALLDGLGKLDGRESPGALNGPGGRAQPGAADLVADYARPLATRLTAALLGIPGAHVPRLGELTRAMVRERDPAGPEAGRDRAELLRLWARIIGDKRRAPGDDVLTGLVAAHQAGHLSARELASVAWGLFSGGVSPVTTAIAAGAVELARAPAARGALRDPATAPAVIGELLRLTSPFPVASWRFALGEVTLAGTRIPPGAVVLVSLAAANRDPEAFGEPEAVLTGGRRARAHLAFGHGPHYCPGAPLARAVTTAALSTLLRQRPGLRLSVPEGELRWHGVLVERCYDRVPVRFGCAPAPGQPITSLRNHSITFCVRLRCRAGLSAALAAGPRQAGPGGEVHQRAKGSSCGSAARAWAARWQSPAWRWRARGRWPERPGRPPSPIPAARPATRRPAPVKDTLSWRRRRGAPRQGGAPRRRGPLGGRRRDDQDRAGGLAQDVRADGAGRQGAGVPAGQHDEVGREGMRGLEQGAAAGAGHRLQGDLAGPVAEGVDDGVAQRRLGPEPVLARVARDGQRARGRGAERVLGVVGHDREQARAPVARLPGRHLDRAAGLAGVLHLHDDAGRGGAR